MHQQTDERDQLSSSPGQPRSRRPFWHSRVFQLGSLLAALVIIGTVLFSIFRVQPSLAPQAKTPSPTSSAIASPAATSTALASTPAALDAMVREILIDQNTHGWDPQYHGILINWRKNDPQQVNCSPDRCDTLGHSTRHDGANDLRDLMNLYWYKTRHPGDTTMDSYIARILPTVKQEWGATTLSKGWIYYTLRHLATYSNEHSYWDQTIQHWVQAQYEATDPRLGVHHATVDTVAGPGNVPLQDGYRVDHDLELGLALVDAGTRYHHPEWIAAGQREVNVVKQQTFSTTYHLFNRMYLIHDSRFGSNRVFDTQARMGENGQEIEALIRAGSYTHTSTYTSLAKEMIDALQNSPLRDKVNGGFQFKMYLGPFQGHTAGYVDTTIKETRQLHMLIALHVANHALGNSWTALEQEMIRVAVSRLFLPGPVPGFTYRVLPNGNMYPCPNCSGPKLENWDSSEANNIALEALQTVLDPNTL